MKMMGIVLAGLLGSVSSAQADSGCAMIMSGACPGPEGVHQRLEGEEFHKAPKICMDQAEKFFKRCERGKSARVVMMYVVDGKGTLAKTMDRNVERVSIYEPNWWRIYYDNSGNYDRTCQVKWEYPYLTKTTVTETFHMNDNKGNWSKIVGRIISDPNP